MTHAFLTPIRWVDDRVELLDQRRLPFEEVWLTITDVRTMADAIRSMAIRGAPAIGIATAMGVALAFRDPKRVPADLSQRDRYFEEIATVLRETRPTAVNLRWALDRMSQLYRRYRSESPEALYRIFRDEALKIHEEDIAMNRAMGEYGAAEFSRPVRLLTICNTGALATGGYGTALGVIRSLRAQNKLLAVYACETRPYLQGARLTMWELEHDEIPGVLICDNMAGFLMQRGEVDAVITGADRIVANGDTANKIGTYTLAVLARQHGIPFYVAAPVSTIDLSLEDGSAIPIEERSPDEVRAVFGHPIAPPNCSVWNPAFDVTPGELITAIITNVGVIRPPYRETLAAAIRNPVVESPGV